MYVIPAKERHPGLDPGPESIRSENDHFWIPASAGMTRLRVRLLLL